MVSISNNNNNNNNFYFKNTKTRSFYNFSWLFANKKTSTIFTTCTWLNAIKDLIIIIIILFIIAIKILFSSCGKKKKNVKNLNEAS